MKENKVVRYDRKKNKVLVYVTQEGDITEGSKVIGNTKNRFEQEYEPSEMKRIYKNLNEQVNHFEKTLKDIKNQEKQKLEFEYDEIVKLKKMLEEIKKVDKLEKDKVQKSALEDNLKKLKEDLRQLKPVIQNMPK